jgi:hypothetical protein
MIEIINGDIVPVLNALKLLKKKKATLKLEIIA